MSAAFQAISGRNVRVGVIGAGVWANNAHLPGWHRDSRCDIVAVCDVDRELAEKAKEQYGAEVAYTDAMDLIARDDIDVVDVCTSSSEHFRLSMAALNAGKHVLCEKPVAFDFRQTEEAADLANSKGLKTKLGFTFRYSPGVRYATKLIQDGFVGEPYIFNAYEQNSQWIDPQTPLRQVKLDVDPEILQTQSLEGYGAPVIDIGHFWVGADYERVVGTMKNFVPERMVRATGKMQRINIDDGTIYMAEYTNGVISSVQTSFVTVGNYPGIEVRLYGSKGAVICRLIEEFGVAETIRVATPDDVEFRELEIPAEFYPEGGTPNESWRTLFYANLIKDFLDELTTDDPRNQGNFRDGAWVQEAINAVEQSFHERRWVELPLPR
ncbi:MAG TPA: Gfo/Idh/MocA family oxidoreductase [Thermomicrobiales bacterium]|jgi:predicted dehydrogenase|nr:Gfo/Idh/MocA family oxidoreductase [Thermomicrobiales bacterium]